MYETLIAPPIRSGTITLEQEPVTLAEARRQCELGDNDFHNHHLAQLITSVREQVEADTGLVCYTSTFTLKMTEWPSCSYFRLWGARPVTSVTSITYIDSAGATQTWGSSNYVLDTGFVVPIVRLAYGVDWPSLRGDINGITVTFVAGYASVAAVPQMIKNACLLLLRHRWDHLGIVNAGGNVSDISESYDALIGRLARSTYP